MSSVGRKAHDKRIGIASADPHHINETVRYESSDVKVILRKYFSQTLYDGANVEAARLNSETVDGVTYLEDKYQTVEHAIDAYRKKSPELTRSELEVVNTSIPTKFEELMYFQSNWWSVLARKDVKEAKDAYKRRAQYFAQLARRPWWPR